MYTLLYGAKKNAGDFLIYDQTKRLIEECRGERDFLELPRWVTLGDRLEAIHRTKALVLCGGPGYSSDFYPHIFPLTSDLADIRIPIIPLGLGWVGQPMHAPESFEFTPDSVAALRYIHEHCETSSCRDVITQGILARHGFHNVVMSGCPSWFDLSSIGKPFVPPAEIARLVVTPPQRVDIFSAWAKRLLRAFGHGASARGKPRNFPPRSSSTRKEGLPSQLRPLLGQCLQLLREVGRLFPHTERYCVFHRGLEADRFTPASEALTLRFLRRQAERLGYRTIDAAYGIDKIAFYQQCDLHVGYRVHAHIRFLSLRKPSFLLQEDGRGLGLSTTLALPDVSAYSVRPVSRIIAQVAQDQKVSFARFQQTAHLIDQTYQGMARFLRSLP